MKPMRATQQKLINTEGEPVSNHVFNYINFQLGTKVVRHIIEVQTEMSKKDKKKIVDLIERELKADAEYAKKIKVWSNF